MVCGSMLVPSAVSKATVYFLTSLRFHCAVNVMLDATVFRKFQSESSYCHPMNVYPSRVGLAGRSMVEPSLTFWSAILPSPPFKSNFTVYVLLFFVQEAVNVKSCMTGVVKSYGSPPNSQPLNVYPSRVGLSGLDTGSPSLTVWLSTLLPSLLSNVTVCFLATGVFLDHSAFNVMLEVTGVLKSYGSPSRVQPWNV